MRKWLIERLKWLICDAELRKLDRYQRACTLAFQWNGQVQNSSETARWIQEAGEGERGMDISEFRESLRNGRDHFERYPPQQ